MSEAVTISGPFPIMMDAPSYSDPRWAPSASVLVGDYPTAGQCIRLRAPSSLCWASSRFHAASGAHTPSPGKA